VINAFFSSRARSGGAILLHIPSRCWSHRQASTSKNDGREEDCQEGGSTVH